MAKRIFAFVLFMLVLPGCEAGQNEFSQMDQRIGDLEKQLDRSIHDTPSASILVPAPKMEIVEKAFSPFLQITVAVEGLQPLAPVAYVELAAVVNFKKKHLATEVFQMRLNNGTGEGTFSVVLPEFGMELKDFTTTLEPIAWWPAGALTIY